jgi:carbamoyl-phosphate synthase large subunit
MTSHRVLITAIGGNVGQGVLKSLRAARTPFHIVGIDMEILSAGFSLVDSYYQTPRSTHPDFPGALKAIAQKEELEAIYVCSPSELEFFATAKQELERELGLSVFVNPPEVIRVAADKLLTANFLRDSGFPSPETVLANNAAAVERLIERFGFPLITKPRAGFSSRNVFVVNSRAEIAAAATLAPDSIVQRYLPDDQSEFTAGTFSGNNAKVRGLIILRRDLIQGTTYRTELVENQRLSDQIVQIVEALGAVGPCNLQFRLLGETAYVFEINARFSGTSGIRHLYGFNDCEMIFHLLRLGAETKQPALRPAVVLRYWNEVCIPDASFQDLRAGRRKHSGYETILPKSTV